MVVPKFDNSSPVALQVRIRTVMLEIDQKIHASKELFLKKEED